MGDMKASVGVSWCAWCEEVHDNPVTVDPFSLGVLARRASRAAFTADCATVNEWIDEGNSWTR